MTHNESRAREAINHNLVPPILSFSTNILVQNNQVDIYNIDSYFANEEHDVVLYYTIHHAEGLDSPNSFPGVTRRNYGVISWIQPGKEWRTIEVQGIPDPVWNQNFCLPLDKDMACRFLNVEVVRLWSKCDPGTSTGMVVVGRAQIPLPKELSTPKSGRFGLVRMGELGCKAEGHIKVSMELKKRELVFG